MTSSYWLSTQHLQAIKWTKDLKHCAMNMDFRLGGLPLCSSSLLPSKMDQFLEENLHLSILTQKRRATRASIEPQCYRVGIIDIGCSLNKDVVESSLGRTSVEVASIDISLEMISISLDKVKSTGTICTRSARIAAKAPTIANRPTMNLIIKNPSIYYINNQIVICK